MSLESFPTEVLERIVGSVGSLLRKEDEEDISLGLGLPEAKPADGFGCISVANHHLKCFALVNKRIAELSKSNLHEEIKLSFWAIPTEDRPGLHEVLELFHRQLQGKSPLASQIM